MNTFGGVIAKCSISVGKRCRRVGIISRPANFHAANMEGPMLTTNELNRRKRTDVCSRCGWGRVLSEEGWECVNPNCFRPFRIRAVEQR